MDSETVRMSLVSKPFEQFSSLTSVYLLLHMVNRESLLETRRLEVVLWNEKVEGKKVFEERGVTVKMRAK